MNTKYEYKVIRRYKPSEKTIDGLLKQYSEDGWRYVGLDPCGGMVFEREIHRLNFIDTMKT